MCKTLSVPNWLFLKVSGTYIQLSSPALLLNCCLALTPYLGYSSNMKAQHSFSVLLLTSTLSADNIYLWNRFSFTLTPLPSLLPCKIFSCTPPFLTRRPPLPLGAAQLLSSLRLRMVCSQVRQGQGSKTVFFPPLLNKRLLGKLCSLSTRGCLVYQCCHIRQ